ncbi:MAG: UDP-3-O-(3-hydroxymyristoyl)glucosamine N-acyltransferase [Deltaproteobacteria bacterium]|nr:UDP-3-O-(3-hydroxymyristoyl)glucosamine N-acyltransferase [Deltaproteobacteria bacterium]
MALQKRLEELAHLVNGRLIGRGDTVISGVATIEEAAPGAITFLSDQRHLKLLASCRASAIVIGEWGEGVAPEGGKDYIAVKNPQLAFAALIELFRPASMPAPGVHPKSEVHPRAELGEGVSVGAFAVVEEGARIGPRAILFPNVYVGRNASVGEGSVLYPGVAVREDCVVGSRVIIHCNAVVGSDGFGYAREGRAYHKIPQRGIVRIEDDCEIGACATIDRATLGETVIASGTKIDNLVQIAHNVKVGRDSVIAAQTGIAGSARIGSGVQFGGQVGVVGHIEVGDGVMIGAKSGVTNSVPDGAVVSGIPAIAHKEWLRAAAIFGKLPELKKRISELKKRISELEKRVEELEGNGKR